MISNTQPDAVQILNSLINSVLVVDNNLVIHYANPAAQQLLAQSSRKLFGTPLPELTGYFSLNIEVMLEILKAALGFTDPEVPICVDGRAHILSLIVAQNPHHQTLLEMALMDCQRRLTMETI